MAKDGACSNERSEPLARLLGRDAAVGHGQSQGPQDRRRTLQRVEKEAEKSIGSTEHTTDICGTNVLGSESAHIHAAQAPDDQPKRNAADDECHSDGDDPERRIHAIILDLGRGALYQRACGMDHIGNRDAVDRTVCSVIVGERVSAKERLGDDSAF